MAKTVFYARVSTKGQSPDSQIDAARRLGCKAEHIFVEVASGASDARPQLKKALTTLEKGDTLAAFKLDRVGRSLAHLIKILDDLQARGVHFLTSEDGLSTKGATGRLVLNMLGCVAEFERNLMLERTLAGLAAAKARGKVSGRRRLMQPADIVRAKKLMAGGELNSKEVARMIGVSPRTLFRQLRREREVAAFEA